MTEDEVKLATTPAKTSTGNAVPEQPEQKLPSALALVDDAVAGIAPETARKLLGAHSGKLAIGVAATLGMMIYYNWRERRLAKQDPEGHARLQRLKARVRSGGKVGAPGPDPLPPPGLPATLAHGPAR